MTPQTPLPGFPLTTPEAPRATATLTLAFESDWHVGSGTGIPGHTDRRVVRDHRDLPHVPAKTLTGVLRDGCELAARALDDGKARGPWHDLLLLLFGDQPALSTARAPARPRPATLSIRAACLPDPLAQVLAHPTHEQSRAALTFLKPGVHIDRRTGTAKPDFLRFEELVRHTLPFSASLALDLSGAAYDPATHRAASALLVAGAALARRLGGKRRRGAGLCRIHLGEDLEGGAKAWLETGGQPGPLSAPMPPPSAPRQVQASGKPKTKASGKSATRAETWRHLPLTLTLEGPVSIPSRVTGNLGEGPDMIPGTLLLGHVAKVLDAAGLADTGGALRRGAIRVSPLTVEVDGGPGLPVPFCLASRKGTAALQVDGATHNRFTDPEPLGQFTAVRGLYVAQGANKLECLPPSDRPALTLRTHNTIQDDRQRPTEEVGGVYSYQALPAGTILRGEITLATALFDKWAWKALPQKLSGPVSLGRSRKDDYGAAHLWVNEAKTKRAATPRPRQDAVTIWCVSDVLLVNERLRWDPTVTALHRALRERGLPVKPADQAFIRVRRLDSWQRRWGLPRPSLVALAAGSCARFPLEDGASVSAERLAEVQAEGLGDRRAEGFGRLRINHPLTTEALSTLKAPPTGGTQDPPGPRPTVSGQATIARQVTRIAWKTWIEERAALLAGSAAWRRTALAMTGAPSGDADETDGGTPSMSQLATLRPMIQDLGTPAQDRDAATLVLDKARTALAAVINAEIRRPPLKATAERVQALTDPETFWATMAANGDEPPPALALNDDSEVRATLHPLGLGLLLQ
ncbi:MAG: hypothetical protein K9H18_16730, partial [Rhodospirillum sp.]|nr:hypothetical protein [Rhodospirillum sp.]